MDVFSPADHPHRRLNLLTGEWILVSPHRTKRPWQGQLERPAAEARQRYDPTCYLCPGNERAGGVYNPAYESTYVFDNDFMALLPNGPSGRTREGGLLVAESERGLCRVICYSPDHSLTIAEMPVADVRRVVDVWTEQYDELGRLPFVNHVQIFENRGALMGSSNPHPHGQIWCNETVPQVPSVEGARQAAYLAERGSCLLCDYAALEERSGERLVCGNANFCAVVPYWATWPFETMILPRRHVASLLDLTSEERDGLADVVKQLTVRYDNLFEVSFPYTMGIHQQPTDGLMHPGWHLHLHFFPPLLRSATVRKFMVGYEMLANPQRDLTAESAAERLRAVPATRFDSA